MKSEQSGKSENQTHRIQHKIIRKQTSNTYQLEWQQMVVQQKAFKTMKLTNENKNYQDFHLRNSLTVEEEYSFLRTMGLKPLSVEDRLVRFPSINFLNTITI